MMIFHLIKKDVLIAKKYILIVLLAAFAIPLLFAVIDRLEGSSISGLVTFTLCLDFRYFKTARTDLDFICSVNQLRALWNLLAY